MTGAPRELSTTPALLYLKSGGRSAFWARISDGSTCFWGYRNSAPDERVLANMNANHLVERPLGPQGGETQLLNASIVMSATGDIAEASAGFGRLVLALSALALERFRGAQENPCPDALRGSVRSCLAGATVDPFGGQLLRFREADSGCQLHSLGHNHTEAPVGKGGLGLTVVGPPQFSL